MAKAVYVCCLLGMSNSGLEKNLFIELKIVLCR